MEIAVINNYITIEAYPYSLLVLYF